MFVGDSKVRNIDSSLSNGGGGQRGGLFSRGKTRGYHR